MADTNARAYTQGIPFYADSWRPYEIGATVPPVNLSRYEWNTICKIVNELCELSDEVAPNSLADSLIQGKVLVEIVEKAKELRFRTRDEATK